MTIVNYDTPSLQSCEISSPLTRITPPTFKNKLEAYQELSKDKRTLHLVMVTTHGIARNSYLNMIQNEVTMDDLFAI